MENENNGTEKSETSDDEYLLDLTKLQLYMYEPYVSKESLKESCPGKESSDLEEDRSRIGNILSGVLVVNANQRLLMQKVFAAWIKKKFLKVISKVYFHLFGKYFYRLIC